MGTGSGRLISGERYIWPGARWGGQKIDPWYTIKCKATGKIPFLRFLLDKPGKGVLNQRVNWEIIAEVVLGVLLIVLLQQVRHRNNRVSLTKPDLEALTYIIDASVKRLEDRLQKRVERSNPTAKDAVKEWEDGQRRRLLYGEELEGP